MSMMDRSPGEHIPYVLSPNQLVIVTANTRVPLWSPAGPAPAPQRKRITSVVVRALLGNTGSIYVGGPAVTIATGLELAPGEGCSVAVDDLGKIFFVGANATDGVSFLASGNE